MNLMATTTMPSQVGGLGALGLANYDTGMAIFEATHGTAPKTRPRQVNPAYFRRDDAATHRLE